MRSCIPMIMVLVLCLGAGCGDDASQCVEVTTECAPLYTPEFDEIFARTLVPTCAPAGGACHAAEGAKGGLVYEDPDVAYDLLLGLTDGNARVIPFDASCSRMITRIAATRASKLMPPGAPLADAERCTIVQWVANGAER